MRAVVRCVAAIVLGVAFTAVVASTACGEEPVVLPVGGSPAPVPCDHFPSRLHAVVWRNWNLVEIERLAATLQATPEQVAAIAASMGLPPAAQVSPTVREATYITIVRRNWHLLPYEQILDLTGLTAEELNFALREDDFLFVKLGNQKPACEAVRYAEPDAAAATRAAEIRDVVARRFGAEISKPGEPRLAFVERLSALPTSFDPAAPPRQRDPSEGPRFIYSYFGSYGDPLSGEGLDPYPDGLLARLAEQGVNGVWMHVLLRQLAPGGDAFPEFGEGREERLAALRELVARGKRHGIDVYLYLNEPRAMPNAFYDAHPSTAGSPEGDYRAFCTSDEKTRKWLAGATEHVFREVPGLGGAFTITASENLTHCASHGKHADCPRCKARSEAELVAEVNALIATGVHRAAPDAKVIAWDWGWNRNGDASDIIARLPKDVWLQSVSEWSLPIERGGVRNVVGEYSLSSVGPGPRALANWKLAEEAGLKTSAKVQLNCTWELSSLPYLPVPDLAAEHCVRLREADVDGMQLSWSLGGYPSPNLHVAKHIAERDDATAGDALDAAALARFGSAGAPHARKAWTAFSDAYREYPYDISGVYSGPQQMGPANLLYPVRTGYQATMVGIPYDDVDRWRGPYPPGIYAAQFEKIATGWRTGLPELERAVAATDETRRAEAEGDLRIARAAELHFASVARQVRFVEARDSFAKKDVDVAGARAYVAAMDSLLEEEIDAAVRLFPIARDDSRIGFEASNHYFYVPLDLVEKVVNCEKLRADLATSAP